MQQSYAPQRPQDAYRRQAILTASPIELIIMLYDGCRKNMLLAQRDIERHDPGQAHRHLTRAQDILGELVNCLDMRYPVAENLLDLYEFLLRRLAEINLSKEADGIPPLVEIVDTLRSAWQGVFDQQKRAF